MVYTIKIKSDHELDMLNDGNYAEFTDVRYGGKTYTGFELIDKGVDAGAYRGYAEGDEVIFYDDEIETIVKED